MTQQSWTLAEETMIITRALEKLGPTRVAAGLAAFGDPVAMADWDRCFLARAYGAPGRLGVRATVPLLLLMGLTLPLWLPIVLLPGGPRLLRERVTLPLGYWQRAQLLGLTPLETAVITTVFDTVSRRARLRALAREWLELEPRVRRTREVAHAA